jgi:uncharacterized membrane protein
VDQPIASALDWLPLLTTMFIASVVFGIAGAFTKPLIRAAPMEDTLKNRLLGLFRYAHIVSYAALGVMALIVFGVIAIGQAQLNEALHPTQAAPGP